jgi:putative ABC transport system ATP-binding protein
MRARGLTRVFGNGATSVRACDDISFDLSHGELVVVRGRSGSGKTTLLGMLGALDPPTSGAVYLNELDLTKQTEKQLVEIRRSQIGFVFQNFGLLPMLTAAENVEVPLRLAGMPAAERDARVASLLESVGLTGHAAQHPAELSGGQQQRVGIARALARNPVVLLADEPTGQLDTATAATMMDLLAGVVREQGVAAIVTTHDPAMMERADRVLELHDGRLVPNAAPAVVQQ